MPCVMHEARMRSPPSGQTLACAGWASRRSAHGEGLRPVADAHAHRTPHTARATASLPCALSYAPRERCQSAPTTRLPPTSRGTSTVDPSASRAKSFYTPLAPQPLRPTTASDAAVRCRRTPPSAPHPRHRPQNRRGPEWTSAQRASGDATHAQRFSRARTLAMCLIMALRERKTAARGGVGEGSRERERQCAMMHRQTEEARAHGRTRTRRAGNGARATSDAGAGGRGGRAHGRFSGNHSRGHCSSRHSWSAGAMPRRTRTSVSICSETTCSSAQSHRHKQMG